MKTFVLMLVAVFMLNGCGSGSVPTITQPANGSKWRVDNQQQDITAFDVRIAEEEYEGVTTSFQWADQPHPWVTFQQGAEFPARVYVTRPANNFGGGGQYQVFPLIITTMKDEMTHTVVVTFTMGNPPTTMTGIR